MQQPADVVVRPAIKHVPRSVVRDAHERIDLGRAGYVLYGVEEENEASTSEIAVEKDDNEETVNSDNSNRTPQGIAMLKEDIAEIELLIRKGTPVTIILTRA